MQRHFGRVSSLSPWSWSKLTNARVFPGRPCLAAGLHLSYHREILSYFDYGIVGCSYAMLLGKACTRVLRMPSMAYAGLLGATKNNL